MNGKQRWEISKHLILDSIWNSTVSKLVGLATVVATISGFTLKELFENYHIFDWLNWSYTVCLSLLILICRILWVASTEIASSCYSNSSSFTHVKMAKIIRELINNNDNLIIEEGKPSDTLAILCNKMRECFDKMTNSHCCVSIKLIEGNEDGSFEMTLEEISNHRVHNVARDNNHNSRDTEDYKNAEHYIRENTAFSTIIGSLRNPKRRFYINNRVELSNSYITTSPYPTEDGNIQIPYKSELVFPIMRVLESNRFSFVGFLCIDSDIEMAFKTEGPGIEICKMMAHSLFWIFTKYDKFMIKND